MKSKSEMMKCLEVKGAAKLRRVVKVAAEERGREEDSSNDAVSW